MKPISELRNRHQNQPAAIIGMGPSLLHLDPAKLAGGRGTEPIICLYESIHMVESFNLPNPVYSLQKDGITGLPQRAPLLVHAHESGKQLPEYSPCYTFDNDRDFGIPWNTCSGITSVHIAHLLGCRRITKLSFDLTTHGDRRRAKFAEGMWTVDEAEDHGLANILGAVQAMTWFGEVKWMTPSDKQVRVINNVA